MKTKGRNDTVISNRKARFEFEILETYEAGIILTGTEVKSLRAGKANLQEAYCYVQDDEVFIKGMTIAEYDKGGYSNHDPQRVRKLLLRKKEIAKLRKGLEQQGYTISPLKLYFSDRNFVKIDVGLARGKKTYDKRESIKDRDMQRDLDRHSD